MQIKVKKEQIKVKKERRQQVQDKYKRAPAESIQQLDLLRKHHRFLRDSSQSGSQEQQQPRNQNNKKTEKGQQLAKKYYDKLFKEYALVDLTRFQKGQIGCRWRTQTEVVQGKGQSQCSQVNCNAKAVSVYEMNFGYKQNGEKRNALVKVSVCHKCAFKLNYKKALKQLK